MDFAVKSDSSHLFPSVLLTSRYTNKELVTQVPARPNDTIQTDSIHAVLQVAALDSLPIIRFARWTAEIINTGYIPTGTCIDIGNIQEILQVNHHETVHIGLPFRTNAKLMKNVSLEASVGYGFRDRAFKGMGRIMIACFNIISSLSMLIIDKKKDILTLRNLGADTATIRRIFLIEGWLISSLGALIGLVVGLVICLIQQHFGIITLGSGTEYIISAYPVEVQALDILIIGITVIVVGFVCAWQPVRKLNISDTL